MATSAKALSAINNLWRRRPTILSVSAAAPAASTASSAQIVQNSAPCFLAHSRRHLRTSAQALSMADSKKFELSSKYSGLDRNVWVEFVQMAFDYKPLNLGQGLPDDLIPQYVLETMSEVMNEPVISNNQYTRGFGHPRLIAALSKLYGKLLKRGDQEINPLKEVLVTQGAYEALFTTIMGFVNPGDEVIIIEPYFDCYEPMVRLAGGTPRFIALSPTKKDGVTSSADWKLDPAELSNLFNSKTKAIIYNNPNNPLGKVYKRDEIDMICDLCKKHDVLFISDDVYEHMVFEGSEMIRVASLPGMWDRTITIGSAGKTFSVTGWKLGWAIGPEHLIRNCQVVHQNCVYACPTPTQEAVARGFEKEMARMDSPDCFFNSIGPDLQKKRDALAKVLEDVGLNPVVPEGGYFIMADWSKFAEKLDLSGETDKQADYRFVKWLCKNKKLLGIPPSAFFSDPHKHIGESYIRLCFIKNNESLKKCEDILREWRAELN